MNKPTSRGRRAGNPDTRDRIQAAARARFLADGYQAVTMRAIAADAGVDVALVSYYFKSKQGVFAAAMALTANPAEVFSQAVQGDLDTLAVRVLQGMLGVWDDPVSGAPLRTIAAAATAEPDLARLVREAVGREIVTRLAARLGGVGAEQRAAAFTTQIAGIVYARYLLRLEPIASMPAADVVARLAPSLQLALGA